MSDTALAASGLRVSRDQALALYRQMVVIRRTEEQLVRLHAAGLIHGACHTYIGEEAVAAGVCAHLRADDTVFSTHRGHGHALAKGVPPRRADRRAARARDRLLGRARRRACTCSSPRSACMGSSGIVGPCILLAAGAGYSFRLLRTDRVSVAFFGDGAANNGAFHEGLNLAAIWKLPVLFVCENNLYATEVPFESVDRQPQRRARGAALRHAGGRGRRQRRARRLRGGRRGGAAGPGRRRAHADRVPDLPHARPRRGHARRRLPDAGGGRGLEGARPDRPLARADPDGRAATAADLDAIDAEVAGVVEEAVEFAKASPWPDPATAARHVYADA